MARTISEIKAEIGAEFMAQRSIRDAYGIRDGGRTFGEVFSPVSVESVMFYVVASAMWVLEKLLDRHRADVEGEIAGMRAHTLRWYVRRTLEYMRGRDLVMGDGVETEDRYETEGMTDAEVEAARVVKYAVATEDSSRVYIKVAGADRDGRPVQLDDADYAGVCHYLSQIKDAGVSIMVQNDPADKINVELVVLYDPGMLRAEEMGPVGVDGLRELRLVDGGGNDVVRGAVSDVVTRLPFNGEYRNSELLAAVQGVAGVRVADIVRVEAAAGGSEVFTQVVGYRRPSSGYYSLNRLTVRGRAYSVAE